MTATDLAFEEWVARARDVTCIEVAEKRNLVLSRGHVERAGPCPGCGGEDRFRINLRKDFFACRGCDASGRSILLMQLIDGCDFLAACEALTGEPPPRGEGRRASPQELAEREEARRAAREAADAKSETYREAERARLYRKWTRATRHAPPMLDYYAGRGIHLPDAFKARFAPDEPYFEGEVKDERGRKRPRLIYRGPAILLPITDAEGAFRGLHMTWLDRTRTDGKAEIFDPDTGEQLPAKKVRGSKKGNRILLVPASGPAVRQVAGEGPETVMSIYTADRLAGRLREDTEYVSSADLGNLCGPAKDGERVTHPTRLVTDKIGRQKRLTVPGPTPDFDRPAMFVPAGITHLTLLADADSDPFFTRCAMERAVARHAAPGRHINVAWPPEGYDFNDVLRGLHVRRVA